MNEQVKYPNKIYAIEKIGSNGIHCLDYRNYSTDIEYIKWNKQLNILPNVLNQYSKLEDWCIRNQNHNETVRIILDCLDNIRTNSKEYNFVELLKKIKE